MRTHQTSAVRTQAAGERQDWRHRAACRNEDPELFFGYKDSGQGKPRCPWELDALQVCNRCPVLAECRAWALGSGQEFGVAGGMTAQERRAVRRNHQPRRSTEHAESEQTRTIRQLAAAGHSDPEIAALIGKGTKTVADARRRAGITSALRPGQNRRSAC